MLRELEVSDFENFIGAWFLSNTNICDHLIKYFESSTEKRPGVIGSENDTLKIDQNIKKSTDLSLSDDDNPIRHRYEQLLQEVVDSYRKKYIYSDLVDKWSVIELNIQKYNPGDGFYGWHSERTTGYGPAVRRHLTFMTYLNDVSDQGETEFFYQKLKIRPQKGLTLIWPVDWTHTHRGITSPTQVKYIITGWYYYTDY